MTLNMANLFASLLAKKVPASVSTGPNNRSRRTSQRQGDTRKKGFEGVEAKVEFTLTVSKFTTLHEMRAVPPPSNDGKLKVMGIGQFLTSHYAREMENLLHGEKQRADKSALKKGTRGKNEEEAGVGVGMFEEGEEVPKEEEQGEVAPAQGVPVAEQQSSLVQPKIEEKLEYGERDILQRAKVYTNRDSVKHYKRFWKTWKSTL